MSLKRVDKLVITFLVDNNIEWFTKMPPGFTQELRYQLGQNDPPIDEVTGTPFIDFENYCCGAHGFSAFIETKAEGETESHYTLFDAGPESKSITRNVAALKVPIERVSRVVLSHWHSDHSGGILAFLRLRNAAAGPEHGRCVVDLHPDRPEARGIAPPPRGKVICRLAADPTFEELEREGAVVEKHDEGHVVAGGTLFVSGEIPRITAYEQGLIGGVRWKPTEAAPKGEWVSEEHIMDERYAAIDVVGKGLVLFSSCSHAGVVNVAMDAVKRFKRPIHMIIGGLHLGGPELADRIEPTVDFFANKLRPSPAYILPMHCSGFGVKVALEKALGDGCVPVGAGVHVEVEGSPESEAAMFPPTIV
ncbi:MBL-fold metallohydrolase domain-containing protein [Phanerochaete sordida]|uniref:MBL-fold metallohydrolase domain-containing protein n=1 Tax=Phanerochaete sordida TaxID=48140 RepID=A0A9P3LI08_9APHY|nr:MBL-fold metallohydrolase domain-containing protein [Phanerochaete sordida]